MRNKIKIEQLDETPIHGEIHTESIITNEKKDTDLITNTNELLDHNIKTEDIDIKLEPYNEEHDETDTNPINSNVRLNQCPICQKKYFYNGCLVTHINQMHPERENDGNNNHTLNTRSRGLYMPSYNMLKPHECNICHKRYLWINTLQQHIRKIHPDFKPHECSVCHKCYNTKLKLKTHVLAAHTKGKCYKKLYRYNLEKRNVCKVCRRAFASKRQLTEHLPVHTGKEMLICNICRKRFNKKNQLAMHLKIHKRNMAMNSNFTHHKRVIKTNKRYECKICRKGFSRSTLLKIHTGLHGRNVPFKYNTEKNGNGSDHSPSVPLPLTVYIPTVEKVYECELCHKRFLLRTALRVHLQEHSHALIGSTGT